MEFLDHGVVGELVRHKEGRLDITAVRVLIIEKKFLKIKLISLKLKTQKQSLFFRKKEENNFFF